MNRLLILLLISSLSIIAPWSAQNTSSNQKSTNSPKPKVSSKNAPLNQTEILDLYETGEFESLVKLLENLRRQRQMRNREDSIFIYKYLGVIYGANENTRKKAEAFLYQMLKLAPDETLANLGVGDSIEAIFGRVRQRYAEVELGVKPWEQRDTVIVYANKANGIYPSGSAHSSGDNGQASVPLEASTAANSKKAKSDKRWLYYGLGAGAVGLAVISIILFTGDSDSDTQTSIDL